MKNIFIFLIKAYQVTLSPLLHSLLGPKICRYEESCSNYALRIIKKEGAWKGSVKAGKRLLSCSPFGTISE